MWQVNDERKPRGAFKESLKVAKRQSASFITLIVRNSAVSKCGAI